MSVSASRWVVDYLKAQPPPARGGPSRAMRAVMLALAIDAAHPSNVARTSAPTIAKTIGYEERQVRRIFDDIERTAIAERIRRPGRADAWQFPAGKLSPTPDIQVSGVDNRDPGHFDDEPRTFPAATPDIQMSDVGSEGLFVKGDTA